MTASGLIVDSFAGGGGASLGIQWALGRSPDIAINHDREAIALHAANHPDSLHLSEDVWKVDPVATCAGRPVDLMWLSPDCKHFSKAKGGKPRSKKIRGLAWVAHRWARAVRPAVIVLENVEEFQTWGPLLADGKPDKARAGLTFRCFVGRLRGLGYVVEWRELRACDYGEPTIRKRLFLVARCDGEPIVWPTPTHGKGRALPWRTAAECIDWSLPCPSIFLSREEAKALGVKRPLASATLRRIARGIRRYVIESPKPFLVSYYGAKREGDYRTASLDEPLPTQTTENRFALVEPFLVHYKNGQTATRLTGPLPTQTTRDCFGLAVPIIAKADAALVAPHLVPVTHQGDDRAHTVDEPLRTITGANRGEIGLVASTLIQTGYGEDRKRNDGAGQVPRVPGLDKPLGTVVAGGVKHALVSAFLAKHYGGHESPGSQLGMPISTVTTQDHHHLVAASLMKLSQNSVGQSLTDPLHTVMPGAPRFAEVRAFLTTYYGPAHEDGASLFDPVRTVTPRDRFGLVTVSGVDYVIADIGMRMLSPRELYRAQGFPDSYVIDVRDGPRWLSKAAQVRMCGNSVPPRMAMAIVAANLGGEYRRERVA